MPDNVSAATVPRTPGLSSGDYALRFGGIDGHPLMTARIPCASYKVRVSIAGETITPDPGTLETLMGTCNFPWNQEQASCIPEPWTGQQFQARPSE